MIIAKVNKEQISKTVRVSNSIEGYKTPSSSVIQKVKTTMGKYNVKVSSKK